MTQLALTAHVSEDKASLSVTVAIPIPSNASEQEKRLVEKLRYALLDGSIPRTGGYKHSSDGTSIVMSFADPEEVQKLRDSNPVKHKV